MIEINSLDHNGNGIGKINNKIVFVKNALPNEIVEINITKEKKNYIEANVTKYIKKAKNRIDCKCLNSDFCGGCDLMHISYEEQLEFKQNKVIDIIKKYVNEDITINNIIYTNNYLHYRNKVEFKIKNNKIGFFKEKTYNVIDIDDCLLCNDKINNIIKDLKLLDLNFITSITCRTANSQLMIIIETDKKNLNIDCIKEKADSIYLKNNDVLHLVHGNEKIEEKLGNYIYNISPQSFFQINKDICLLLYEKINSYIGTKKNILDLYCGTGSIGIFVSKDNNVCGIEINKSAIENAIENARLNNIKNINFICNDCKKGIKNINFNPDIIIIDPPRSGLNEDVLNHILKINPEKIIYVSCDTMTLARDLNILKKKYIIKEITPFDMFPLTKHVECVCVFNRQ